MNINKLITNVNRTVGRNGNDIKFIVIHYVGATGGAEANCKYFKNTNRSASAHYFVGHEGEIWQCVEDEDTAWHCGGKIQGPNGHKFYGICTNYNSIGIELCVTKIGDKWVYHQETLEQAAALVQMLMKKYKLTADNVIRHFDVTGKSCPANYLNDTSWGTLHKMLTGSNVAQIQNDVGLQPYSGFVEVIYEGKDGLDLHSKPTFTGCVATTVRKGEVFTIVGRIKVGSSYMYKLKSGLYVTTSKNFVKYRETLSNSKPAQAPVQEKKSNTQIAKEVLEGKWGNGEDRKKRLTAAGYNYSEIQNEVNKIPKPSKKSNTQIAKEVIDGKWGNGEDRKKRLTAAGYDYKAIQNEVNKLL